MRLDHTAPETVSYKTIEDVIICGVPIKKNNLISIGLFGMHYDEKHWIKPLEFIPERFDPESKYFKSPTTGKARDHLSFIPFSVGMRSCPGQTLARLVQKIALPYYLANLEYEIEEDVLKNDKILFNTTSQFNLDITVT
eukprot:CAMPEP_0205806332 /NCGR_PEP_ID=MMETSP0205-20121125/9858_1 /ASSEMBLY_ACC=CAM_ASM_000278 /TAXON_ID=36767 /ORGANISM="Euplotes focardii, Strain TN1" /LENGTH=138 /DNA_ID=CAMNT_0053079049 /DNA_START=1035 /DNA_END=1447 /DNA_ORIENTATION=-